MATQHRFIPPTLCCGRYGLDLSRNLLAGTDRVVYQRAIAIVFLHPKLVLTTPSRQRNNGELSASVKLNHSVGGQRNSSPVTPFLGF
jgi:hypothetical protein